MNAAPSSRDTPPLTRHARLRWQQRCANLDLDAEWYLARRVGKNLRRKLRERCVGHRHLLKTRAYQGYWYAISPNKVVFVVGGVPGQIVTVWRLGVEDETA